MENFNLNPDTENVYVRSALMLALGMNLSSYPRDWPTGLVMTWNEAAKEGVFDGTITIGDLARAFLKYRFDRLVLMRDS